MGARQQQRGRGRGCAGLLLLMLAAGGGAGCDLRPNSPAGKDCPACECKCNCEPPATTATPVSSGPLQSSPAVARETSPSPDVGELVASATRKMMHEDGVGCLADLDRLAALDAKMDARLAATRGQCEMLVGRCQPGKQRVARWYQDETGMLPERAEITAEQIGAMRCRAGDSSERDRLLRAYFDLSDGAYMNKRPPEFCKTALQTAKDLIPKVQPRSPDDSQISGGSQALFHTAASCFARAGDCKSAWTTYRELFPNTASTPEAAAMMPKIIQESYDSSILFCGAQKQGPPPVTRPRTP